MNTDNHNSEQDLYSSDRYILINSENYDSIVERIFVFLEFGEWKNAILYAEQALNFKPKAGILYLAKLMAELKVKTKDDLKNLDEPFDKFDNCVKASNFDSDIADSLKKANDYIRERNDNLFKQKIYSNALQKLASAETEDDYLSISRALNHIKGYNDADKLADDCFEKAEIAHKNEEYNRASELLKNAKSETLIPYEAILVVEDAVNVFNSLGEWKDSAEKIEECNEALEELKTKKQEYDIELERKAEEERAKAKQNKKRIIITVIIAVIDVALTGLFLKFIAVPEVKYRKALSAVEAGNFEEAYSLFKEVELYKNTNEQIEIAKEKQEKEHLSREIEAIKVSHYKAIASYRAKDYTDAIIWFEVIKEYCLKWGIDYSKIGLSENPDWWIERCYNAKFGVNGYEKAKELQKLEVGDIFTFGKYYQSNNKTKEPVEWIVLDKVEIGMLVLSKNIIDYYEDVEWSRYKYWRDWGLKDWLNKYFLNTAFDDNEKKFISSYDSFTGACDSFTDDIGEKIKLFSGDWLDDFQKISGVLGCKATKYAISRGTKKDSKTGCYSYWLMPYSNGQLCYVNDNNVRYWIYDYAPAVGHGVRPFMIIRYK